MERKPSYFAILPAKVRYCKDLPANAKLLYAEITAMADATGYCWATNAYLADLFGLTIRAIRGLISKLEQYGFVTVVVLRNEETNEVEQRQIYIDPPESTPSGKNFPEGWGKNLPDPQEKIFPLNNTSNNNIPPYSPPKGDVPKKGRRSSEPKETADWKPERFEGFWKFYPRHENRQKAIAAWDKLRPNDDLISRMGVALVAQKHSESWTQGIGIPHASTWLNNRRWEDEITVPTPPDDDPSDRGVFGWQ